MPDNLAGLNIDTDVYLNRANSDIKMYEILQEEIAHYDTTAGDIVTKDTPDGRKQEHKARSLAMMRAVSLDDEILESIKDISVAEKLTGAYPTFTNNDTKALFHELRMIKQQNWITIKQNQEIINQLKRLNKS
ncbi:hypothetical protein LMB68_02305 [Limosilactobacillus reuteri]|uniref:hypothetical protein n=1 Tax=Limosilactobacillus reuteri TaxID=1598 RepID=UPI001E2D5532|nr:hypothetical protein [Limosilactobacillus reuteri]MCC4413163.1 hypothetical protein [Limosilactobacillus reuteri]